MDSRTAGGAGGAVLALGIAAGAWVTQSDLGWAEPLLAVGTVAALVVGFAFVSYAIFAWGREQGYKQAHEELSTLANDRPEPADLSLEADYKDDTVYINVTSTKTTANVNARVIALEGAQYQSRNPPWDIQWRDAAQDINRRIDRGDTQVLSMAKMSGRDVEFLVPRRDEDIEEGILHGLLIDRDTEMTVVATVRVFNRAVDPAVYTTKLLELDVPALDVPALDDPWPQARPNAVRLVNQETSS